MLLLSMDDVQKALPVKDCMNAVEAAFNAYSDGRADIAAERIYHKFERNHTYLYAIGAAVYPPDDLLVLKVLTLNWDNPRLKRIPHQYGIIYLCEGSTGVPLAIMDANYITAVRTGAVVGLGAKYFARKDSEDVGVVGSRDLARYALLACKEAVPSIKNVRVYSPTEKNRKLFAEEMAGQTGTKIKPVATPAEAVKESDIIITATAAEKPILKRGDFATEGLFFAGIGSEQEVDPHILIDAKVFIETPECRGWGCVSKGLRQGVIDEGKISAEFSQVINGHAAGRESPSEFIYFSTIGIAIEDAMPAALAYTKAKKMGLGKEFDMFRGLRVW